MGSISVDVRKDDFFERCFCVWIVCRNWPRLRSTSVPLLLSYSNHPLSSRLLSKALSSLRFQNSRIPRLERRLLHLLCWSTFISSHTEFSCLSLESSSSNWRRNSSTLFSLPLRETLNPSGSRSTNLSRNLDRDVWLMSMMLSLTICYFPQLSLEREPELDSMDLPSTECKRERMKI